MVLKIKPETISKRKTVSILGSTGSIGCNTVDLIRRNPSDFEVIALSGNQNVEKLAQQAIELNPEFVAIADPEKYTELKSAINNDNIEIAAGSDAVEEAAQRNADWVMASIVGSAGLSPTLKAIERGATIGLANKESLVCAGNLMMDAVKKSGSTLLPVDSEHNAIFQVIDFENPASIDKIILTASGGPFRTFSSEQMKKVTPEQAVNHPNWSMGAKISIDSATMMNKGLEFIEAYHLFPVELDQIEILVHPQSVIHSMVSYCDGSVLAQLGTPDMRTPIGYALSWPERMETPSRKLDLAEIAQLTFEKPDPERFPAINLAYESIKTGGSAPTVLNSSNEIAVEAFLKNRIGFQQIPYIIEAILGQFNHKKLNSIQDVLDTDKITREMSRVFIEKMNKPA